jgi:hypothetical protein
MTPNDLDSFFKGLFMNAVRFLCVVERARARGLIRRKVPGVNLVGFLRGHPPFSSPCPETIIDVRNARCVPCPQYDALVEAVVGVLFDFGHECERTFDWEPRTQHEPAARDLIWALGHHESGLRADSQKHESTLDRLLPPTRKAQFWKALETLRDTKKALEQSIARQPIPGLRRTFQALQRELCWQLYRAFKRWGPAPTNFPETAIDAAIAAMLITLQLESGTVAQVAARVRKRIDKRLADESLIPDPGR